MENELVVISDANLAQAISEYETQILEVLAYCGLPADDIFVPVCERKKVFTNAGTVISLIPVEQRHLSTYVSKFFAAVGAGLFDAALNYLWDETIVQLRKRVAQYDIQYFFDLAVVSEKRSKLSSVEDLDKVDDSELIKGAKEIGLISDIGFKHLDYIKYMRNWASAAHPNQTGLTGLQIISWLETCIKEVVCLPETNVTIQIGRLLKNIKTNTIAPEEADTIGAFFCDLTDEKANSLASGFFGIYTRKDTTQATRQNILLLIPLLWERVDESARCDFGTKYAQFVACNDQEEAKLARAFLQLVNGEQYIPDTIRSAEIKTALDNLLDAHEGAGNFYSEPAFARQLERLIGNAKTPRDIDIAYARTIVYVFITNGNGTCWDAEPVYIKMIENFNQRQNAAAIMSFMLDTVSSKLQFHLCQEKFIILIDILKQRVVSPPLIELLDAIKGYKGPLSDLKTDRTFMHKVDTLKIILK